MKKIYNKIKILFFAFLWFISIVKVKAETLYSNDYVEINYSWWWSSWSSSSLPKIWCEWLPGCKWKNWIEPDNFLNNIIENFIQIVAIIAVFALILSWIMYMMSAWDDGKAWKAKKWIIWSLVWVFLSTIAWWIVSLIANLNFK